MKVLSCNVRGLGGIGKWRYISDTITKEDIDMVCIQETKAEVIDPNLCRSIWGSNTVEWVDTIGTNRAGGIISI